MQNNLVSLRASMDHWEQQQSLFVKLLECYLEALGGVEKHVLMPCAAKAAGAPITLEQDCSRLRRQPDAHVLDQARINLGCALESAAEQIQGQLAGTVELAEVLKLLADTTGSLRRRSDERESRFLGVASDLQSAADQEDLVELRAKIYSQITQLTQLVEEMKTENRLIVEELEHEMDTYRRKLDEAERMASRDMLTGLSNRRALQSRMDELIQSDIRFCLLIIDLNRFKAINDQHGHLAGDELLRVFAERLRRQLRAEDTAARWGGDEFVVILPCRLSDAMVRSRLLEQALHGDYVLHHEVKSVRVRVGLSMGVAEHRSGETADQLLDRADQTLYLAKASR